MKHVILLFSIFLVISSCSNDVVETTTYLLTEEEKAYIPYDDAATLLYENQDEETVTAELVIDPYNFGIAQNEFGTFRLELKYAILTFEDRGENFILRLNKTTANTLTFSTFLRIDGLSDGDYDFNPFYDVLPCDVYDVDFETDLGSFNTDQFSYENVLILESCVVPDDDNPIDTLIYSPTTGLELILYSDGSFLKRKDS